MLYSNLAAALFGVSIYLTVLLKTNWLINNTMADKISTTALAKLRKTEVKKLFDTLKNGWLRQSR